MKEKREQENKEREYRTKEKHLKRKSKYETENLDGPGITWRVNICSVKKIDDFNKRY